MPRRRIRSTPRQEQEHQVASEGGFSWSGPAERVGVPEGSGALGVGLFTGSVGVMQRCVDKKPYTNISIGAFPVPFHPRFPFPCRLCPGWVGMRLGRLNSPHHHSTRRRAPRTTGSTRSGSLGGSRIPRPRRLLCPLSAGHRDVGGRSVSLRVLQPRPMPAKTFVQQKGKGYSSVGQTLYLGPSSGSLGFWARAALARVVMRASAGVRIADGVCLLSSLATASAQVLQWQQRVIGSQGRGGRLPREFIGWESDVKWFQKFHVRLFVSTCMPSSAPLPRARHARNTGPVVPSVPSYRGYR